MTDIEISVAQIVFRDDLYPRIKHDPALVQRYAENIDVLPPIEINQRNELIDGFHRWTAHRKVEAETIRATITTTTSDAELIGLAIERNAKHGLQLSPEDKKHLARQLYLAKTHDRAALQTLLSVSKSVLGNWLHDIDRAEREERKQKIFDLWLACRTAEEIAATIGMSRESAQKEIEQLVKFPELEKLPKVSFSEEGFQPPIYNIWSFAKKTNEVSHFGNSEVRMVDNLLYLYTEPLKIVFDPFAGGGSTIDVCRKRMRRYWVSDRKPIIERETEIRLLDVIQSLPRLHWDDVQLTYLDPPYWKQAEGKYSDDKEDLANMSLPDFTDALTGLISRLTTKQSQGVIALLIQPTQWNAEGREFTDHISDVVQGVKSKKLRLENRVSCPYSTEQYTPQMVDWAKANHKLLALTRELIIWRFV